MSNVIKNAVTSIVDAAVPSNYAHTVGVPEAKAQVVEAVVEYGVGVVEGLRRIASENGLSEALVENALIEVGLVDAPEPEVEAEPETLEQKIDRLLTTQETQGADIARLLTVARSRGLL